MPELRKDLVSERWVIIATERDIRPQDYTRREQTFSARFCPFCPGNESATPPALLTFCTASAQTSEKTPWTLRVVPNKFPALKIEGELNKEGEGVYDRMNGIGAHEVIIETSRHGASLASLSQRELEDVLWAYRARLLDLRKDHRFRYGVVFKNHGTDAGASLEHSHSQLIAMPIIPRTVQEELDGSLRYYGFRDRCVFCDMIRQEIQDGARIVFETEHVVAFAPFASRAAFEVWVLPRRHASSFEASGKEVYEDTALCLQTVLRKLARALGDPPYNYILHTAPFGAEPLEHYHWHIEILPALGHQAGFEWGSGFTINPTPPEKAAEFLRTTEIDR